MKIPLPDIKSDYQGFQNLIDIAAQTRECVFETIEIDMQNVTWLDANMCAPFGAVLSQASQDLNTILFSNISNQVEEILAKNGFLSNYGWNKAADIFGTTIEYKRFGIKESRSFTDYIAANLIKDKGVPQMSVRLNKKISEGVNEIFQNAVVHSCTKLGVFTCGQFYPRKQRLDFSIADLGIGIRNNVNTKKRLELSPVAAIAWAFAEGNTTKNGDIPGGSGLKILQEFINVNEGRIQVVSDQGYWELAQGRTQTETFSEPFPGTVVNIEINTADANTYILSSEIRPEDIF